VRLLTISGSIRRGTKVPRLQLDKHSLNAFELLLEILDLLADLTVLCIAICLLSLRWSRHEDGAEELDQNED
jgi:hypothetical protein